MATGSTWQKKKMDQMKRVALVQKLGNYKPHSENRPAPKQVHNAVVARSIAAARKANKDARKLARDQN